MNLRVPSQEGLCSVELSIKLQWIPSLSLQESVTMIGGWIMNWKESGMEWFWSNVLAVLTWTGGRRPQITSF
jgi:hypothetical protein